VNIIGQKSISVVFNPMTLLYEILKSEKETGLTLLWDLHPFFLKTHLLTKLKYVTD